MDSHTYICGHSYIFIYRELSHAKNYMDIHIYLNIDNHRTPKIIWTFKYIYISIIIARQKLYGH